VPVHLSREEARRIAVRAQLLDAPRPTDLVAVVRQLTLLQIDPTAAVAPSADLVAWSRLGSSYRPAQLQEALEQDRTLFELNATVRPMDDLALHLSGAADWPSREKPRQWLHANDAFRRDVLDLLGASGPLLSRDIPDTSAVPCRRRGGPTTATSPRCSSSSRCEARSRSPDGAGGSGCGTWPSGSTRPARPSSRWTRPPGCATNGVVMRSNIASERTGPLGPVPRFSSRRACAAMSITFDTMLPSTVLETVNVAGTSGWRSWAGRSVNIGSYPVARSVRTSSVIAATDDVIPSGPSTRSRMSSCAGTPLTRSSTSPTSL